jgi:hypothetical protein
VGEAVGVGVAAGVGEAEGSGVGEGAAEAVLVAGADADAAAMVDGTGSFPPATERATKPIPNPPITATARMIAIAIAPFLKSDMVES